ncbi:MAG TPA: twin-arginine translocation signal domain-containing protein, partial [Candidatus Angelobacter sp.]|nr:twin-arginine translocation signal domain-containing protein [Candidatus Angelobacter sp.]
MNRRQLLKGLGVLPIAGALGCAEETQKPAPDRKCHTLQVTLEGAFAVVLRRQPSGQYRVTAFSPASPTQPPKDTDCPKNLFPIESHAFSFNGKQQPPGNYHFELLPQGLDTTPRPIIDIGFRDFTAETERWRLAENFVTIELPSPKTISFYGQPDVVVFAFPAGAHRTGQMPSNHILEYQVNDPAQVKMVCRGVKDPCVPSSKSTSGVTRFSFAVGLPPQKDQDGQHAVKFFNYLLCGFFPDLFKTYSISRVEY